MLEEDLDSVLDVSPAEILSGLDSWRIGDAEFLFGKQKCMKNKRLSGHSGAHASID